jgi:hypothetical protein
VSVNSASRCKQIIGSGRLDKTRGVVGVDQPDWLRQRQRNTAKLRRRTNKGRDA